MAARPGLDALADPVTPSGGGCADCLAQGRNDWVHLRLCMACGHVGCCDSSPGLHATAHAATPDHPVVESCEPGEPWAWCDVHQATLPSVPDDLVAAHT